MSTPDNRSFNTTHWTKVLSVNGQTAEAREALAELCADYYEPVVAFLGMTRRADDEPRELAHEFFATLLSQNKSAFATLQRGRGRFRSYLLGALKHFISNRNRLIHTLKRGAGAIHEPIITDTHPDICFQSDPRIKLEPKPNPDLCFEREWALAIIERALLTLESENSSESAAAQFPVLKQWLSFDVPPLSQAEAARKLDVSEGSLKVAIYRLRKRFRELIRSEIAKTIPEGESIDSEMSYLLEILNAR